MRYNKYAKTIILFSFCCIFEIFFIGCNDDHGSNPAFSIVSDPFTGLFKAEYVRWDESQEIPIYCTQVLDLSQRGKMISGMNVFQYKYENGVEGKTETTVQGMMPSDLYVDFIQSVIATVTCQKTRCEIIFPTQGTKRAVLENNGNVLRFEGSDIQYLRQ